MIAPSIRLIVFDIAGTIVDYGSFAPVAALVKAFRELGIELSAADARGPMGLHKRDHIVELFRLPAVCSSWKMLFKRDPTRDDVEMIFQRFLPLQIAEAQRRTELIPGALSSLAALREKRIAVATTTGYPRVIGQPVAEAAHAQGWTPDHSVFADDVASGRPAPWMIYRNMEATGVYPPSAVVKVGDTVPDIEEGRNAGTWSIGVTESGSEIGMTLDEWQAIPSIERERLASAVGAKLLKAGAHAVIRSVDALPGLLVELDARIGRGDQP